MWYIWQMATFLFDRTGRSTPERYAPDVEAINRVVAEDWMPRGS